MLGLDFPATIRKLACATGIYINRQCDGGKLVRHETNVKT